MTESTMTSEQLNDLRRRYLAGGDWTREELKKAIHSMIADRLAQTPDPKPKGKVKRVDLGDLL